MNPLPAARPITDTVVNWSEALTRAGIYAGIAIAAALAIHLALFWLLDRLARASESETDDLVFDRLRMPLRFSMIAIAIAVAEESDPLLTRIWDAVARFIEPALFGWVVFALVKAFAEAMDHKAANQDDQKSMRSRRTRIAILSRSAGFLITFVTVALVLFGIPGVRNIGTTLLASAGVATLAVGAAAQPALKSLIAGIQIALTEPIRIGDFVVVDNQNGRVEDIRLSYVVICTSDERRLIVPTSKFLDASFENWSRQGGGITGSVVLPVKPGAAIQPIREAYQAKLAAHPDWDRRTGALHVSDIKVGSVDLKLVMSASGTTTLNRLRPAMREAMLEWLRENMPEVLCDQA